jgi:outer membrane receptor protein involved in Fe transport
MPSIEGSIVKRIALLLSVSSFAVASSATAQTATQVATPNKADTPSADTKQPDKAPRRENFSTGVAKARDLLDSAISTSSLDEQAILKFSPRSVSDLLRNLPGVRSDASQGEGYGNISIRGLPIASTGSKYTQLQEDGLPVLELGDIPFAIADTFVRLDTTLGQVQAIRGGSASTFASNSPGGVINLISKTGVNAGGSIQTTIGLDHESYRTDIEYGAPLSDTLRFHVGGFYRRGNGPRDLGFTAQDGGQIKVNITKEFAGGYVRIYGKYLNDRTPAYGWMPMLVSGTAEKPIYTNVAGIDVKRDSLLARNVSTLVGLDGQNNVATRNIHDGQHPVVKSVGFEAKFDVAGWSVTNRFRYSGIGGSFTVPEFGMISPAAAVQARVGAAGGTLSYATGPNAGAVISNPSLLNGNGLLAATTFASVDYDSLDNFTNDLRAGRSWTIGGGDLTATAGFYRSRQNSALTYLWGSVIQDVVGGGNSALVNVSTAAGVPVTANGQYGFGAAMLGGCCRETRETTLDVSAPYGSLNFQIGKLSIGGSLRYDMGEVAGSLVTASGFSSVDINGDGVLSSAERMTSRLNLGSIGQIDYSYNNLSYSASANYRFSQVLSMFGRYSLGARANVDRLISNRFINFNGGALNRPENAKDQVRQAEGGVKFRSESAMLNVTGFWAESADTNLDPRAGQPIERLFRAKGIEVEGGFRRGIASITAGATYTKSKIAKDHVNAALIGAVPENQPDFIFQATPQIETQRFAIGATVIGTTSSYTGNVNRLRLPGFVTTNAFAQLKLSDTLLVSLNASNLFNTLAMTGVAEGEIPANGIVRVRTLPGRTLSATARLGF